MHLVTIHTKRLTNLTPEQLVAAGFPARAPAARVLPYIRQAMGTDFGHLALIGVWKLYWNLVYYDQLTKHPRFEEDEKKHPRDEKLP